ncbi:MAG TPA: BamA/TamA family outer membrane protein [Candidatus Eisenbacteria bacterium]|nr:BamA/TamA family outer membrane protein [Candidatus Eisenbacteria bacterium]
MKDGRRLRGLRGARLALAVVFAALGIGASAPAHAQYFGQNKVQYRTYDWRSIESDHFQIYFYPELDSLARRVLDLAEKTNTTLTKVMGHQLTRRIPIILYGSHNDFAQTNVTPQLIDAGTGGFTELLRNRVVLPFMGPYEDLRHVVVHELVHAYMFDMLYGGAAGAMLARQSFYQVPLWFAEGLAEYVSLGMESNAEMFLRDGTISGYLPPLMYSGGYIVYKQGQSAVSYLVERFGDERLRDLLQRIRQMRSFEGAFQKSLGVSIGRFDEQWRSWLRKRYWPTVASKQDPEHFARRLTDHRREQNYVNTAPSVSPQGDRVVFVSDRRQYTDVYLMSAFDGKVLRRVIRGERNVQFESIPSFRASLTWSPDGRELALVAKSNGYDVLYVISAESGKIIKRFDLGCPSMSYPSWSPTSDSIAVVGVRGDRADIYMVDRTSNKAWRLTNDTYDEMELTWRPDGNGITFSSDRLAPVVLHPLRREKGHGAYGIFGMDLQTREITQVLDTQGEDHSPAWSSDGSKLAFISDLGGTPNIYLWDAKDASITQLTDVQGGVTSLSWSRQHDRLVFAAFNNGGVDIFAVREALSLDPVMERLRANAPHAVVSPEGMQEQVDSITVTEPETKGALAVSWPDTLSGPDSTLMAREDPRSAGSGAARGVQVENPFETSPWAMGGQPQGWAPPDTAGPLPTRSPLHDNGGPFAVADSVLWQKPTKYRGRLSADYAGAGFYASTLGVIGQTQFAFSDFLGNHNLYLATDVISDDLSETNALLVYTYLPRRWDFSTGVFHFKNYYSSQVSPLGEQLGTPRLFSERSYGALVSTAYPFDRFRRLEFGYTQMFVERQFYDEDANGVLFEGRKEHLAVSSPSISLVGDNALFGYYGPVNGGRYNFTYSPSFPVNRRGLSYQTAVLDMRRYWDMTHGHSFATRVLAGVSGGRNPQTFEIGGFSTLRGYDDFSIYGSRVALANFEYRFPFIQQLGLVGPLPLGFFNLRGVGFLDVGNAWYQDYTPRLSSVVDGKRRLQDLKVGYGTGIRTALSFFIVKVDVAWNTDFVSNSKPQWYFSIGPEF